MTINSHAETESSFPIIRKPLPRLFIIMLLFIAAFAVRLHNISKPPHDFATLRQYQSAHIARDYYFDGMESVPQWRRNIAEINSKRMGLLLEPRILEQLTVLGYRIMGGEHLWIPRVLSSIFWLIGGIFLYLIARKITSEGAAVFCTAFYLYLPFGISASRSFQPDPLMIMMLLLSLFMIIRFHEHSSNSKLVLAAIAASLAIFVKPYSLFLIYCAFISISIFRFGVKKSLFSRNVLMFVLISFLPSITYYVTKIIASEGFLREQAEVSILPHLLLKPYFWRDWLTMIGYVTGYIPFIGGLIGFFTLKQTWKKAFLSGLWIGYFVFGCFFTVHIHTHDYYHLPLIPVVALCIGPVGAWTVNYIYRRWQITLPVTVALAFAAGIIVTQVNLYKYFTEHKDDLRLIASYIGINQQFKQFIAGDFEKDVQIGKEIAEIVDHSTNTILLTTYFGRTIAYNGELSGLPWPTTSSLLERKKRGLKELPKDELFNPRYFTVRTHGKYIKYVPDFFIITAFEEFEMQKDLKNFLEENFPVLAQNDDYLIFDLRKMSEE